MAAAESVEYNGITFRRYPEADRRADREYFKPTGSDFRDGVEALHREVWKDANSVDEVPEGYYIHHCDGDTGNNNPENLECVTPAEHVRRHPDMGNPSDEHMERIVELAKDWHKSDEGHEWHSEHWEESLAKAFTETQKQCEQCGDDYIDESAQDAGRFCSDACKAKARRERGDDDEERICKICRQPFTINKYRKTQTCSSGCSGALISWSKRVGSGG